MDLLRDDDIPRPRHSGPPHPIKLGDKALQNVRI
jgi:hypothetical protein